MLRIFVPVEEIRALRPIILPLQTKLTRVFPLKYHTFRKAITGSAIVVVYRTKFVFMLRTLDLNPKLHYCYDIVLVTKDM